MYAHPFDKLGDPALLVNKQVLTDLLEQRLVVLARGPAFDLYSLTPAGRAQLAELGERDGAAPAMAVALCGSLTAACEVRKRSNP